LDQCEAAIKEIPLSTVLPAAVNVLRSQGDRAQAIDFARVEAWFEQALKEKANDKAVQLQLASLRDLQDRYDDLIKIYRDYLARKDISDRERAVVWNNLAYVLAGKGKDVPEALGMINQAIKIVGPVPELLDTRGVVALALGKTPDAIADFQRAIAENPSGMKQFHLALAQMAAGDRAAARRALKAAHDTYQLTAGEVPKLEQAKYRQLVANLKAQ
jgi:tetratricopeptide (TPR) repeat protein